MEAEKSKVKELDLVRTFLLHHHVVVEQGQEERQQKVMNYSHDS